VVVVVVSSAVGRGRNSWLASKWQAVGSSSWIVFLAEREMEKVAQQI
jgi:hypothetical protein